MTKKRVVSLLFLVPLGASIPALRAEGSIEIGGLALGTIYRSASVRSGPTVGSIGFQPGPSFGGLIGQNGRGHFGGELRYLYAINDLKVSSAGTQAEFGGRTHIVNYDLLVYTNDRESKIRFYGAGGGGVKVYQGTGTEQPFQPLSNLALLTKTREALPTVDFGAGVKVRVAPHLVVRLEFRDYITKIPKVFEASPGARLSGIFHNWVPAFGLSWTF